MLENNLIGRGRRLRKNELIRELVCETKMSKKSLIYPIFLKTGNNVLEEIPSLLGQYHYSVDRVCEGIATSIDAGVDKFILFGAIEEMQKDEFGSNASNEDGIIQQALREIKGQFKDKVQLITDVCMCEYTSHGHCGVLNQCTKSVDNDETLKRLREIALSHVEFGADILAPSDMMDGRVLAIRNALDDAGHKELPIMSYSVKYSSSFYNPFRDAVDSEPAFGDRKSYQMDYHNVREALREASTDTIEGADILMVKPALSYLDVISKVKNITNSPVAAYSVSGEYAMIKNAGLAGIINEYDVMRETATSIYRAGADILISYFAKELAQAMEKGDM